MVDWKKAKSCLPFIGIAIFIYILVKLNFLSILKQIGEANQLYLLLALIFVFLYMIVQTAKWFLIARKQKIKVSFRGAFRINLIINFYELITPAKLGIVVRAGYLTKNSKSVGKGVSNIVIDKVLDLSSLFLLLVAFSFVFREKLSMAFLYYLLVFFVIMVFGFWIFYKKERSKYLLKIVYKRLVPKNMKKRARITFDSFYEDLPKKRFLAGVFFISLLAWIMNYLIVYVIGLSLGIELDFVYFLAILPLATLVSQIPITISGLGTKELTMIGLFGLFGVEAVKVFSMSILSLLLTGILPSLIAVFLILKDKGKK
ncbi:MAG: lysylphosphatidylglycerol synthase transmembrane domain-containing protein [Nanoarchaeota archaeon]